MAINFPPGPTSGDSFTDPTSGKTWIYDGVKWTSPGNATGMFLPLAGGTLTGPLEGTTAAFSGSVQTSGAFIVDTPGGNNIIGNSAGIRRWLIALGNGDPETGGNAGSDFQLNRHGDAGLGFPISPLIIYRDNGRAVFSSTVQAQGYISRRGTADAAAGGQPYNFFWNDISLEYWVGAFGPQYVALSDLPPLLDYRIIQEVAPLPSMWDQVKGLNPIKYMLKDYTPPPPPAPEQGGGSRSIGQPIAPTPLFVADGKERWGLVASELQETLIETAATGVKDQPDGIQSSDLMTIVATLTKALQEAIARIEALEAKLA